MTVALPLRPEIFHSSVQLAIAGKTREKDFPASSGAQLVVSFYPLSSFECLGCFDNPFAPHIQYHSLIVSTGIFTSLASDKAFAYPGSGRYFKFCNIFNVDTPVGSNSQSTS